MPTRCNRGFYCRSYCLIVLSSWWWALWCPKHVKQAIRSAIKTSVASSWYFISTYKADKFTLLSHLHFTHRPFVSSEACVGEQTYSDNDMFIFNWDSVSCRVYVQKQSCYSIWATEQAGISVTCYTLEWNERIDCVVSGQFSYTLEWSERIDCVVSGQFSSLFHNIKF